MRVLVLHRRLSGYFISCLRELAKSLDHELLTVAWPNQKDAPFDKAIFKGIGDVRNREELSVDTLRALVENFMPDCVLLSGWADKGYVQVCKELKKKGVLIISGCDTQWKGSLRQFAASIVAPCYVQKFIDVFWVSGERQRQFATKLGYRGARCWDGYYACDWDLFSNIGQRRLNLAKSAEDTFVSVESSSVKSFAFVGRYAPEKGLDTLAEAYRTYSKRVEQPWSLVCAGRGLGQEALLEAGAEDRGFIQPADLPEFFASADAFILPSRFEPWGVVAQEAAVSGLPLIISDVSGAGVHLLRDRWNGRSFAAGDVKQLAECLEWFHHQSESSLCTLGERSYELGKQYTPGRWVQTLVQGVEIVD